ncbi:hypothetical protein B0H14DRAFT_2846004 [Mycena olivaceomarginata]|nr:hypothetical protein B0H14DRAFT_3056059 [Mycena olivaceomarginata]KAJ7815868.1 hypothetical protein B0H14DRAFT_2846004 [Mycena olivaceomarginata]
MAWHHYQYAGRVRPWDGLIGLIMRPVGVPSARLPYSMASSSPSHPLYPSLSHPPHMLTPSRSSATTPSGSRPSSSRGISWAGTRLRGRGRWLRRTCSRPAGAGVCALREARSRQCQPHSFHARAIGNPTLPDGAPPYLLAGLHPSLLQRTATAARAVLQKIHTKSVRRNSTVQNVADTGRLKMYIHLPRATLLAFRFWHFLSNPWTPLRIPHPHLSRTRTVLYHMST